MHRKNGGIKKLEKKKMEMRMHATATRSSYRFDDEIIADAHDLFARLSVKRRRVGRLVCL